MQKTLICVLLVGSLTAAAFFGQKAVSVGDDGVLPPATFEAPDQNESRPLQRPARSAPPNDTRFQLIQPTEFTQPPVEPQAYGTTETPGTIQYPDTQYGGGSFAPQIHDLRREFTELAKQHAELLEWDALRTEVERTKTQIRELKAKQQVAAARAALEKVLLDYPASQAAKQARAMLDSLQSAPREWLDDSEGYGAGNSEGFGAGADKQSAPDATSELEFSSEAED